MFELPYLEICAEILDKRLKNRALHKLAIQQEKCLNVSIIELRENLVGNELKKIWREGLSLRFQFKNYAVVELSLSVSAALHMIEQDSNEANSGLLNLYFSGGQVLSVSDTQELSRFRLKPIHEIVPDVFSKEMTSEYLMGLLSNTEKEIKTILVDQGLIRGIGEAYADEILWYAEISPFSIASKIPLDKVKALHKTIKYVLLDAIKETRKLDVLKFDKADQNLLMIHNAAKKNSPTGKAIKVKIYNNTATYYTDEQIRYK